MHWQDANDFFSMGGRGGFVWGAYGVMLLLMVAEPLLARWRHRAARIAIAQRMADDAEAKAAENAATSAAQGNAAGARR
jgi:heme exporter protein D